MLLQLKKKNGDMSDQRVGIYLDAYVSDQRVKGFVSEIGYFKSVLIQYLDDMCWVALREVRILRKQRNRGIYIKMAVMYVDFRFVYLCVCVLKIVFWN